MKKIVLYSLLALGLVTFATQVYNQNRTTLTVAPDIPPPDCLPTNCSK